MCGTCDPRGLFPAIIDDPNHIGCTRFGSFRRFRFRALSTAPISRNMADNTRFDLSRLEGCTGTLSETGVAIPHAMSPSLSWRDEGPARETTSRVSAERKPAAPTATSTPTSAPVTRSATANTEALVAACVEPCSEARDAAPAIAAPVRPSPRGVESMVDASAAAGAAMIERDERDTMPIGIIVALTLAAWIPVLLLWSSRLG